MLTKDPNDVHEERCTASQRKRPHSFPRHEVSHLSGIKEDTGGWGGWDGGTICLNRTSENTSLLSWSLHHQMKHSGDDIRQVTVLFAGSIFPGENVIGEYFRNTLFIFKIKYSQWPC